MLLAAHEAIRGAAKRHAIGSHARGEYDGERRWLDVLALLDQADKQLASLRGQWEAEARQEAARELDSLALTMVSTSDDKGTALTAAVLQRAAEIVRMGNPKESEECPEHAGQWADACAGCAADRKASA